MINTSTFKHLRFPFSFFLMPVYFFALSQTTNINISGAILSFIILHLLIFPSSNGYNSFQDKDESSIGGLKRPPKVTRNLYYTTLIFDALGIFLALFITPILPLLILVFITMSRLYSYRKIRLKKYPILAFIIVFIFQGAFVYLIAISSFKNGFTDETFTKETLLCMAISSLFMGSMYPLTQIYQHESDKKDGVITLSYVLGYNGSFVFSAVLFSLACILLFIYFNINNNFTPLLLFGGLMLPVVYKLIGWKRAVKKDSSNANFENTMTMNLLTSTIMNLYFIVLSFNNFLNWF